MRSLKVLFVLVSALTASACAVKPVHVPTPAKQPRNIKPTKRINVGLVLGSGGVRGVAEAGVIKVLRQGGVPIDAIIGTSAGSIVGALYSSNPDPIWLSQKLISAKRKDIAQFDPLDLNLGVVSGYTLQRYLLNNLKTGIYFRNLKVPLGVVTTDFETGRAHFINSGPIPPAVNASAAIPGVFRIVHLYGYKFVDGGVSAPVGTRQMRDFYKPRLSICISIHPDLDPIIPDTALSKMSRALDIVQNHLEEQEYRFADIVIHPHVGDVPALADGYSKVLYQAGVVAGKKALPRILKMMSARGIARKYYRRHKA